MNKAEQLKRLQIVVPVVECHLEQPERASEGARMAAETSWAQAGLGHTLLPSPGHGQQEQVLSTKGDNFIQMAG